MRSTNFPPSSAGSPSARSGSDLSPPLAVLQLPRLLFALCAMLSLPVLANEAAIRKAFAERMHERIRTEIWGYCPDENLDNKQLIKEQYDGIRPAPGYPA